MHTYIDSTAPEPLTNACFKAYKLLLSKVIINIYVCTMWTARKETIPGTARLVKWMGAEGEREKNEMDWRKKSKWENQRIFIERCNMKADSIKQKTARLFLDRFGTCFFSVWMEQKKAKQKNWNYRQCNAILMWHEYTHLSIHSCVRTSCT